MLWMLKGGNDAPGWKTLLSDAKEDKLDWRLLDRDAFMIVRSDDPPPDYEGMVVSEPVDGLYIDQQGNSLYVVDREQVEGPEALIEALGDEAMKMLEELGDPLAVIQRLGKAH